MTKRARPRRQHRPQSTPQDSIQLTAWQWIWGWRIGQVVAAVVVVLWFAFQFYSDVGNLKTVTKTVQDDVKQLFTGQENIKESQKSLTEALTRIEAGVIKTQAQTVPTGRR